MIDGGHVQFGGYSIPLPAGGRGAAPARSS